MRPHDDAFASARLRHGNGKHEGACGGDREDPPSAASRSYPVLLSATKQQVIDAAEMLFVERIDVAAEAVRSPEEIGKMLREAEGQIEALTEVIGGTCVVSNLCPAKFACIGCSGNAPDPKRRYQIETKRTWALEQITWARREHLPAEERQMKRVVQDCELLLEEMTLIERARTDQSQKVRIRREGRNARK